MSTLFSSGKINREAKGDLPETKQGEVEPDIMWRASAVRTLNTYFPNRKDKPKEESNPSLTPGG